VKERPTPPSQIPDIKRIPFNGRHFPGNRKLLHLLLFLLTVASTFLVGLGSGLTAALLYSGGIMSILLTHEMGHFLMARRHGISASLPFFIPLPLPPFGTMGAVIKMKGRVPDRNALIDVGVSGPLAGLVVSIPVVIAGLQLSTVVEPLHQSDQIISLGDSLLFSTLTKLVLGPLGPQQDVLLHPLAYAGWVGLFVTALNLLPIGQLDGGHIIYALFQKRSKWIAWLFYLSLVVIFLFFYAGWILPIIVFVFIRKHPPTLDDSRPLTRGRVILGIIALLFFILTFTPVPFGFGEGFIPFVIKGIGMLH